MKLSCIDQSVADGDCYVLVVADVSDKLFCLIPYCIHIESHAIWIATKAE